MTDELAALARLAAAYGLVAAPAAAVGWGLLRKHPPGPLRPFGAGWTGVDAGVVFLVALVSQSAGAVGALLVVPVAVGFAAWRRLMKTEGPPAMPMPAAVRLACRTVVWLTPLVYAVYGLAVGVQWLAGGSPDTHPLAKKPGTAAELAVTLLLACVVAPFYEELGFRRVLVLWAARRRWRPWLLVLLAGGGAAFSVFAHGKGAVDLVAPVGFLSALAVGLVGLQRWKRFPARTGSAVYATAAVFALMHAGVWPSPVPLFVLGLGLGWLVVRTGGLTAAAVGHALFNAVAVAYQLLT